MNRETRELQKEGERSFEIKTVSIQKKVRNWRFREKSSNCYRMGQWISHGKSEREKPHGGQKGIWVALAYCSSPQAETSPHLGLCDPRSENS